MTCVYVVEYRQHNPHDSVTMHVGSTLPKAVQWCLGHTSYLDHPDDWWCIIREPVDTDEDEGEAIAVVYSDSVRYNADIDPATENGETA